MQVVSLLTSSQGHHAGLPDWHKVGGVKGGSLNDRLADKTHLQKALCQKIPDSVLNFETPHTPLIGDSEGFSLWVRMLFSSLVDADFLDTESFMDERKSSRRGHYSSLKNLRAVFNTKMQQLVDNADDTNVNKIRQDILSQCRRKASYDSGIFSLTVPTGGGKTLSSMAFALDHAIREGNESKNRIPKTTQLNFQKCLKDVLEKVNALTNPILERESLVVTLA